MGVEVKDPVTLGADHRIVAAPPEAEAEFVTTMKDLQARIRSGAVTVIPDNERRGMMFRSRKAIFKNWGKPGPCQFPGCGERSIPRSHTLQRGGPLTCLRSKDGHVMVPELNYTTKRVVAGRTGLDLASTFAGFCQSHELLFAAFEERRTLETPRDYILQLYRSACRETVRLGFDIAHHRRFAEELDKVRSARFTALSHAEIPELLRRHPVLRDYEIAVPFEDDDLVEWMRVAEADRLTLRGMIADLERAITALDQGALGAALHHFMLPERLPVALSGQSVVNLALGDESFRLNVLLVVVPEDARTQIMIASPSHQGPLLDAYLRMIGMLGDGQAEDGEALIALVERFLCYGSDHWFLDEAFWNGLAPAAQDVILAEVNRRERHVTDTPPVTFLPRPVPATATRTPLEAPPPSARQAQRQARQARGWRIFPPLRAQRETRLIQVRKQPRLQVARDSYSGNLHLFSRPRRDTGWAWVRTLHQGQWSSLWRRRKWTQIAPFGF